MRAFRHYEHFLPGTPPEDRHWSIGREIPREAAAFPCAKRAGLVVVPFLGVAEAYRLKCIAYIWHFHGGYDISPELHTVGKLYRKKSAAPSAHRGLEPLGLPFMNEVDPRRSCERIELAAGQRGAGDFQDDASERKHIGIARLALGSLLLEERHEPLGVAAFDGGDDVGVALGGGPLVSAAVVPEVGAADSEADLVAAAPDEDAGDAVGDRHPLVAAAEPRELPLTRRRRQLPSNSQRENRAGYNDMTVKLFHDAN